MVVPYVIFRELIALLCLTIRGDVGRNLVLRILKVLGLKIIQSNPTQGRKKPHLAISNPGIRAQDILNTNKQSEYPNKVNLSNRSSMLSNILGQPLFQNTLPVVRSYFSRKRRP